MHHNLTYNIMATYTFYKRMFVLLCTTFCFLNAFSQESLIQVPFDTQVNLSSQIVEGTVIAKESFWDEGHNHIYTKQTIKVHKVFKGQQYDTVEIITKGGVVDLEAEVVSHSLQLREGDLGVFMLRRKTNFSNAASKGMVNKTFEAVSGVQGFYKYDLKTNRVANHFKTISDIKNNFYVDLEVQTKVKFTEVSSFLEDTETNLSKTNVVNYKSFSVPVITSFSSNNVTAGTKSIIIINGSGFGNTKGTVGFSDANYGGSLYYNALDNQVISWTNEQIEVEVPDRAGTGPIQVTTSGSQSIISSQNLSIDFAQVNLEYANDAYQTQHVAFNGDGGITWTMNQSFYNNSEAREAFTRAFDNWVCGSGINWELDSSTSNISTNAADGVNIITFDNSMSSGTLGQCYSRYQGCYEGGEIKWYVSEMDIVFNPTKNWNYSTNAPANDELDFETVTVHELGHGHQLGHVIDTNEVMHYSVSAGESLRILSTEDLNGALDVQSRSTSTPVCNQLAITESSCFAQGSLANDEFSLENNISVYPNPASNLIFIKTKSSVNVKDVTIYNILGRKVLENELKSRTVQNIDVNKLNTGMYILKIETSDFGSYTKKIMIKK